MKKYGRRMASVQERVDLLVRHTETLTPAQRAAMTELLTGLTVAVEELMVAGEEIHQQNEELAATRLNAERERQRYVEMFEAAPDGYLVTDENGVIVEANRAAAAMLGVAAGFLSGKPIVLYVAPESRTVVSDLLSSLRNKSRPVARNLRLTLMPRKGGPLPVLVSADPARDICKGDRPGLRWLLRDIAGLLRAEDAAAGFPAVADVQPGVEAHDRAIDSLLALFQRARSRKEYLDAAVSYLRDVCGCSHVGIRLVNERREIPYEASVGFDDAFLESEGRLSLDTDQCVCIRAIAGTPMDQDGPAMTREGSFACSNTSSFVAGMTVAEQSAYRGVCVKAGFKTVAVVPIRRGENIIGAIHLADRRSHPGIRETVAFAERTTPILGEAIERFGFKEDLRALNETLERRVAERTAALNDLNLRLNATLDHLPVGVWFVEKDGRINYGNPMALAIWGGERRVGMDRYDEYKGWWPATQKRIERHEWAAARAVMEGVTVLGEIIEIESFEGERRIVRNSAVPVRDAQGTIHGVVVLNEDVTEHNRMVQNLEKSHADLTRMNAELTGLNRELNDFAHIVSHDLKAPLRAINSLAGWIAADNAPALSEQGREHMSLLMGRVNRLNGLLEGILAYSRAGRAAHEIEQVDLREAAADAIGSVAPPDSVTVFLDGEFPTIAANRTQLEQVFQNLVGNAVKFMDKPAGEIHIGCEPLEGCWRLYVRDNGPGMEAQHFERIFTIFQTLRPRDEVEGSGVGLAIVKKIVESLGGRIWVESAVGRGSTFFFTIPRGATP